MIDALAARRLVAREPDPTDRRATRIVVTDEGRRVAALIGRARREESERHLERLSEADRTDLDRILRRCWKTRST